ncbi:MAG: leucine--tRNA ligase [Lachnospiraceae bacterium]|jgi:leucyl-tRNA synthetase|nr:leucine--tRNA ligase [Lachnospiraceae bacterium]
MAYNFKDIEKKWQDKWDKEGTFNAENSFSKKKWYGLIEFPYPSAQGLHVGHPRSYTAIDIIARKRRMQGYNVLFPIGFDAFGLPAENYAIKNKVHPKIVTEQNIANFTKQLKSLGFSFDWSRVVNTTDPNYYQWSQWIFVQLFKHGLAYKTTMPINYCTGCKVGLANEEVVNGVCERCGSPVVQKEKSQWMLKITEYAQKLIDDLDDLDYLEKIKLQQKNWIGRSEGAEVIFNISNAEDESLTVYTTRPDTLFGATYMVVAPEHPILKKLANKISNLTEIEDYKAKAALKSDFERAELSKEKTGVEIKGIKAINPLTGKEIPIWISDYVLITYGTGAIMAVPAHDSRDWDFAKKFNLPIIEVVSGGKNVLEEAYTDVYSGTMVNSGFLSGLDVKDAIKAVIEFLEKNNIGTKKVNYKLRDWVFSRQRYWGEPIPIVHCEKCGFVPLDEKDLPLVLPEVEEFEPGENGESPLAKQTDWINTTCPHCGGKAKRETDTMPQWAGSSWYFLRYADPHNQNALASKESLEYWCPVDWYNGGMEHTTLHLLYSRFWHKFLYDIGVVPTKEPYQKRTSQGMILGSNGEKMSKSRGNVVNPNDIVNEFGADTFRVYEMFIGPFDQAAPWSMDSIKGCYKFLERVWNLSYMLAEGDTYSPKFEAMMHKAIKKVSSDIEEMKFNTSIATFMTMINEFYKEKSINKAEFKTFLELLNPFAPHITEELYEKLNTGKTISASDWPKFDEAKTIDNEIELPVQLNGKLKLTVKIALDANEQEVKDIVHKEATSLLDGKNVVKEIYVKNKIYNIVVK